MSSSYGGGYGQEPAAGPPGEEGYEPDTYDQAASGQPGYEQTFGQPGYEQGGEYPGSTEAGHPQEVYGQGGYEPAGEYPGTTQSGYPPEGYGQAGYAGDTGAYAGDPYAGDAGSAAFGSSTYAGQAGASAADSYEGQTGASAAGSYEASGGASATTSGRPDVRDESVGSLVGNLTSNLSKLMRQEIDLAKAEMREEAKKAGAAAGMLAGAGLAGLLFLVFVSITLMWLLAKAMDLWVAALIVTLLWGILAAVLGLMGKKKLSEVNPKPEQTIETLKEDKQWVQAQKN